MDISASNVLIEFEDRSVIAEFIKAKQSHPSPCKEVDGYPIYTSWSFRLLKGVGMLVLSDSGAAVSGDVSQDHNIQPNVY